MCDIVGLGQQVLPIAAVRGATPVPTTSTLLFTARRFRKEILMKLASNIARYLVGLIFLIFGLNGFLHFIPTPPPPGPGGMFMGGLFLSHELLVIMALQALGGLPTASKPLCTAHAGRSRCHHHQHRAIPRVYGPKRPARRPLCLRSPRPFVLERAECFRVNLPGQLRIA